MFKVHNKFREGAVLYNKKAANIVVDVMKEKFLKYVANM